MKLKEAVADTNKALLDFIKHDHWEVKEAFKFYKQSARYFGYATKLIARWLFTLCAFPFIPVLYPVGVIIRVFKNDNHT